MCPLHLHFPLLSLHRHLYPQVHQYHQVHQKAEAFHQVLQKADPKVHLLRYHHQPVLPLVSLRVPVFLHQVVPVEAYLLLPVSAHQPVLPHPSHHLLQSAPQHQFLRVPVLPPQFPLLRLYLHLLVHHDPNPHQLV